MLCALAGAGVSAAVAVSVLAGGPAVSFQTFSYLPLGGFSFHVDKLSAFFMLAVSVLAVPVSIYSLGYNREYFAKPQFPFAGALYNLFLLSMVAVVSANDLLTFLIGWELMSIVSYCMVVFEHDRKESVNAGLLYIIMTHIGTAFIIVLFLLMASRTDSVSFDLFRTIKTMQVPSGARNVLFACMLIGFGTKAGIVPLHIWLPRAHPAAPSNISALMSGVMVKTAVYGIVRVIYDFLGAASVGWGAIVLVCGVVSALLGVMYALQDHDLKRLLAFSSIENVGIIFMGVGVSLIFAAHGAYPLAAVALIAGLCHVMNHALFKGLLFLGAGSVLTGTHTKDMEKLGGLIKRMPQTAVFFLAGSLAISALPPFNGFVGEWLTFQSLLAGFGSVGIFVKILFIVCTALLALTGALAAACFVKAFGITFLGLPRSEHAAHAVESPLSMRLGMGILAGLCLLLGIMPSIIIRPLCGVAYELCGADVYGRMCGWGWLSIAPLDVRFSGVSPALILSAVVTFTAVMFLLIRLRFGKIRDTAGATWDCGIPSVNPRMQYSATAFAQPLKVIFKAIYRPVKNIEVLSHETQPYFEKIKKYEHRVQPVFERYIYRPIARFVLSNSVRIINLQAGSIHMYLAYIFVMLIVLLLCVQ
jgi:hydrogenase-4 component B